MRRSSWRAHWMLPATGGAFYDNDSMVAYLLSLSPPGGPIDGNTTVEVGGRGLAAHGVSRSEGDQCGGNLALTVSEGAVRKYIEVTRHVMETYGVDTYPRQNVEWLASSVDSLFNLVSF